MVEVEVIIHNFKDLENKDLGLLQPGYKYKVSEKRAKYLSNNGTVKIISKENKKNKEGE